MCYQFPIIFDIKPPRAMWIQRIAMCAGALIIFYQLDGKYGVMLFSIFAAIAILAALMIHLIFKEKIKKPKFVIYEDQLTVKGDFLKFADYPFDMFRGRIYLKRRLLEWFIYVPYAETKKQYIHISCLDKSERDQFVATLRELIER